MLVYAAVIYAMSHQQDQVQTNLIFSKQRLMPIKWLTITKAELIRALIGTRAFNFVRQKLAVPLSHCFAWLDSMCVLSWLCLFLPCLTFIGYDCGSTNLNITTLNNTRVALCHMYLKMPAMTTATIQLIQLFGLYPVQVT